MNYTALKATAQKLVNDNGKDIALITTESEFDPVMGQMETTEASTTVKAVVMPYNRGEQLVPDSMVLTDAQKVTIADDLSVTVGDMVEIDSVRYNVLAVKRTNPNVGAAIKIDLVVSK